MYLAEDRILCFEIVTKKREAWVYVLCATTETIVLLTSFFSLRYVKSAKASTDVPTTVRLTHPTLPSLSYLRSLTQVAEFISQRRRWLNGSLFASIHATVFFFRIWTSGQNFFRKIILQLEFIYNAVQLLFTWISLANFYLAFFFVSTSRIFHP